MPAPIKGWMFKGTHHCEDKGKSHNRFAIYEEVWKCPLVGRTLCDEMDFADPISSKSIFSF
jgi:hypothetical protein